MILQIIQASHFHWFLAIILIFLSGNSFCQNENLNSKIESIQTKIERTNHRLIQLKSENSSDPVKLNYIQNIENARIDLIIERTTLENSLVSNNLKLKVKKTDFDTFPENKKTEIVGNPDKYEILK
jgi:hypothetical protein